MTLYVDSSAYLKLYFDEPESAACARILEGDSDWWSARHAEVEVRRNLTRALRGGALSASREQFRADWGRTRVVELDRATCGIAAELAEATGVRTLDALHFGAAQRAGGGRLPFLTYDRRQAQVARSLGWSVLGV